MNNYYSPINYTVNPVTGCFEVYSHRPNSRGYIVINRFYRQEYLHRLAYIQEYGKIPEGKRVAHTCNCRCCINPEHLILK